MRNLKKFLALVLAMMMTLSLMVTVNAAKTPTEFTDLDKVSPAYAEAVNVLSALGIIKGDEGFRPDKPITRAEVSAMLYRIAHNDAGETQVKIYKDYDVFPDVKSDKWYAGSVNYCANSGYLKGYPDGSFGPSKEVTGYEVLVMTLRMLGYGKNGEFEGKQGDWRLQAARYGRKAGLTKQIKEGTLGQPATREMVAEIMFQSLQADLVEYNLLQNYYPAETLIADTAENRVVYANAIKAGVVTLPRNTDLMYVNYGIVGKSNRLTFDDFGYPSVMWVKDMELAGNKDLSAGFVAAWNEENSASVGTASQYIPNNFTNNNATTIGAANETDKEIALTIRLTPVAEYTNAVTECQVAKDVTGDTKVDWKFITEVLNGNAEKTVYTPMAAAGTKIAKTGTLDSQGTGNLTANHADGQVLDALHTSDKWIGATGRTTTVYDISKYAISDGSANAQKYLFVYVDTFLGKVTKVTEEVKDPNGHVILESKATVEVGHTGVTTPLQTIEVAAGSHKVGDLVLVQTPDGGAVTAIDEIDLVDAPEKTPVTPVDVPDEDTQFTDDSILLADKVAAPKRVTIKATWGAFDDKTGIQTTDGDILYASNTFLAGRASDGVTTVAEWYDGLHATKGITNSLIGKTFDLVFDQNGWIIGMKEVLTIESNVGVITGFDQYRVGTGKYLTAVEAYMADGSTKTFNVVDMDTEVGDIDDPTAEIDTSAFKFFQTGADADKAWDTTGGKYGDTAKLGKGALVMFKQCKVEGVDAWYFADCSDITSASANVNMLDKNDDPVNNVVGTAVTAAGASVKTGDALAINTKLDLDNAADPVVTNIDRQLDNKSIIFVAEPEYAYNTGSANEGDNTLKYNVHQGFKNMPTIAQKAGESNILYQQLLRNPEYVLVYPKETDKEYIIKNQETIVVDDSYLLLSRGATFAGYAEYNALQNGKPVTLQVSNANANLNMTVEKAMRMGELLVVTGRNSANYVISANTLTALAATDTTIRKNCGGVTGNTALIANQNDGETRFSENDGVLNFEDGTKDCALTLADNCTIQRINLGTGVATDISIGVAKAYINKEGSNLSVYSDFTFELDQYGYVCSLYVFEADLAAS